MRNILEEFHRVHHGKRRPTILGLREHIFTGRFVIVVMFHKLVNCVFGSGQ